MIKKMVALLLAAIILCFPAGEAYARAIPSNEETVSGGEQFICGTDLVPQEFSSPFSAAAVPASLSEKEKQNGEIFPPILQMRKPPMPSVGTVKPLILPVDFQGDRVEDSEEAMSILEGLEDRFFAPYDPNYPRRMEKQSLAGYFDLQSCGKLKIVGDAGSILPVFSLPGTMKEYICITHSAAGNEKVMKLAQAASDALEEYIQDPKVSLDLSKFDSDHDGKIDGLYVMPCASKKMGTNVGGYRGSIHNPSSWNEGKYSSVVVLQEDVRAYESEDLYLEHRTHSLCHETGHLLGLDDHYGDADVVFPYGLDELMHNAGGFYMNAYFRWILGWIEPKIYTNSFKHSWDSIDESLELAPVDQYGSDGIQAFVLAASDVGMPFSEYYIMEYRNGALSENSTYSSFSKNPGILIWHVNAKLNVFRPNSAAYKEPKNFLAPVRKTTTDPWYYKKEDIYVAKDKFGYKTTPSSTLYSGEETYGSFIIDRIDADSAKFRYVGYSANKFSAYEPVITISPPANRAVNLNPSYVNSNGSVDINYPSYPAFTVTCTAVSNVSGFSDKLIPAEELNFTQESAFKEIQVPNGNLSRFHFKLSSTAENLLNFTISGCQNENGIVQLVLEEGLFTWGGKPTPRVVSEPIYVDSTPPVITMNGKTPMALEVGEPYIEPGVTVTDNLDPDIIAGNLDGKLTIDSSQVDTSKPGTYGVFYTVTDHAGNTTTTGRSVVVKDNTAPTATVSYSTTQPTNGDVVATITPSEPVTVTNTENGSLSYTFTQNGSFTFQFKDKAGNKGSVTATVNNIDKSLPTGTIDYDITDYTNQNVTATLTVDSGVTILNNDGSNIHVFTENGSFEFEIQNALGTKSTVAASVNWIDKEAPVITLNGEDSVKVSCVEAYEEKGAVVTDDQDGKIQEKLNITSNVQEKVPGTYTVTYSATDHAGNVAQKKIRTVTVRHGLTRAPETAASCTKDGTAEHWICSECGKLFKDEQAVTETTLEELRIPQKVHTPGEAADCTHDQTCTVCGKVLTEKLGHDYEDTVTPPTCTKKGYTTHTCTRCGNSYTDSEVAVKSHTPGEAADCTHDQTCTVCGTVLAERLGHDYKDTVIPPTCTKKGYTTHTCIRCKDSYTDRETEPLGHSWSEWTQIKAPTADKPGEEQRQCDRCKKTETRAVTHTHVREIIPEVKPSCTKTGLTEGVRCKECGEMLLEQKVVPALGHNWENWKETISSTCTKKGEEGRTCARCGETETRELPLKAHTPGKAADCTHDQTCTVCGTVLAEKLGHDYKDTVVSPNCTEKGYTTHTCTRCGNSYTDSEVAAKGHTPGEWRVVTPATAVQEGLKRKECTVCHTVLETAVIPKEQQIIPSNPSYPSFEPDPEPEPEPTPQPPAKLPFADVKEGAWYYEPISWAYENGLMSGITETAFSPNTATTRGMIVTILWRLEEQPKSTASMAFTDVRTNAFYYEPIRWAVEQGIIKGKSAASFAPNDPISRQEIAAILYRYAQYTGSGNIQNGIEILRFSDTGNVSDWAKEPMTWAVDKGVIAGKKNGILDPKGKATRAEATAMLMRYCEE